MTRLLFPSLSRCCTRHLAGLVLALLAGCSTSPELQRGRDLVAAGRSEEALQVMQEGLRKQPEDRALRAALVRQKELSLSQWLVAADGASQSRKPDEARALYERVLSFEPDNRRAQAGLQTLDARRGADERVAQAEALAAQGKQPEAEAVLRAVLAQDGGHGVARRALAKLREKQMNADSLPPTLKGAMNSLITLELRDTPLRNAFDVISRTAPLNFVFDRDVRADSRVTLTVRNSPVHDVIRLLLLTQQLDRKVLNDNSLLIYPATQAKQREYQDLTARVFFLANADAKQAQSLLRTLVKTREVHIDEKLNMVAIRDTPDAVRLAERLIDSIDVAEPEVMLEVEILEVSRSRALDLGIQFPDEIRVESTAAALVGGRINLRNTSLISTIANPALRLNLLSQDTDVNLLANPRIRARNREKAKILIGEKLPVFTSTSVQGAGVSSSVSYLDVGLKLEVEPNVYLDDEVGIKVMLEVNSNLERITEGGNSAFRLGTRTAQTSLRLRDGETQVLAGLINDNERETLSKLPGLGDLPGIGRAFGNTTRNRDKSEIVLLITPRVLRNITPPDASSLIMAAGTEAAAGAPPLVIAATPPRALAMSSSGGGRSGGLPAVSPAAVSLSASPAVSTNARPAEPGSEAPSVAPNSFSVQLQVPATVSIGKDFSVAVELNEAGGAQQGEVVLQFDPSLIGGGSGGRAIVQLAPGAAPGVLVGSITLRALAAGSGSANLQVAGGSVRLPDGQQRPVNGGAASLRIGL